VSSVMKFWFTQAARSRAIHSRRSSLSTPSKKVLASSTVGAVLAVLAGDGITGGKGGAAAAGAVRGQSWGPPQRATRRAQTNGNKRTHGRFTSKPPILAVEATFSPPKKKAPFTRRPTPPKNSTMTLRRERPKNDYGETCSPKGLQQTALAENGNPIARCARRPEKPASEKDDRRNPLARSVR
jgi:hypothetical protein